MHRLPLSLPDAAAPSTPTVGLCRALGTHPAAVVLSTLGFKPVPQAYQRAGGNDLTWFIDADVAKAHALFGAWELPLESAKNLATTAPSSPFLAGMCALQNFVALTRWGRTGHVPAFQRVGNFLRPAASPLQATALPAGAVPVKCFLGFGAAAAIIACGFLPWPELTARGDQPAVAFAADSLTFPGLTIHDIARVCCTPASPLALRELPGFPPEEHPFFYALQSILSLGPFQRAQEMAHAHPLLVLQSPVSPASVIASKDALREGNRDTQAFRDAVRAHLKKSQV